MDYAAKQAGFPSNVAMDLQSSANTFAKGANLFAGIGALGQVVDRAFQLADATSASDKTLIAARFIPDIASIASWAAKPGGRIGSALVNGVAALGNGANNLASYAGLAAAAPPISVDPGSSLGAFFNGVFNYGSTGALFGYGGLNTGQGLYNTLTGKPIAGSLQSVTGALDLFQGGMQVSSAGANIGSNGFTPAAAAVFGLRLAAGVIGAITAAQADGEIGGP